MGYDIVSMLFMDDTSPRTTCNTPGDRLMIMISLHAAEWHVSVSSSHFETIGKLLLSLSPEAGWILYPTPLKFSLLPSYGWGVSALYPWIGFQSDPRIAALPQWRSQMDSVPDPP